MFYFVMAEIEGDEMFEEEEFFGEEGEHAVGEVNLCGIISFGVA